jgi:diaminohydroxyphosphoribosylaminopyrimidine deaminase/5-amino-6-(5-phosphoribosylamino)uracil reductase
MTLDETYMRRAIALAEATAGLASPNPQVGCVLVRYGQILGEGTHLYDRLDHAEIAALKQAQAAGHHPNGATAYVTLEPCSHHGRTGPCADALIEAGIARCVVATADPNPLVSGRGVAKLQSAGVEIAVGLLQAEARALNNAFACSITRQRPFVTLKAGLSVDGQLAPAPSTRTARAPFFLTGAEARADVQLLRHASDAILCGIGTVLADDPLLTDRTQLPRRRPLIRVILDTHLRTPVDSKLVQSAEQDVWLFCAKDAPTERAATLEAAGAIITRAASTKDGLDLADVVEHLHRAKFLSVLLEAGSVLNGAFLRANLVDRVVLYFAERELGPDAIPFARNGPNPFALQQQLLHLETQPIGADIRISGLLHDPWSTSAVLR